jgi:glycerophosphoryl diester phosphodiesterase
MRLALALFFVVASSLTAAPFLVAHRGVSSEAPENTLPAFELAWKQGADAIEGDFHLTKDGEIVCIHDADTKKSTGKKLVVATSTLAELQALDAGILREEKWQGTRIPTLSQVLATVPAKGSLFLEVKCGPEIVSPLLTTLSKSKIPLARITVIAFDAKVIKLLKAKNPQLKANWLCSFKRRFTGTKPSEDTVFKTLKDCRADGLGTNAWAGIDAPFLARLTQSGCSHHVWTVDDAATATRFLKLGTASITTNRPGALRRELAH